MNYKQKEQNYTFLGRQWKNYEVGPNILFRELWKKQKNIKSTPETGKTCQAWNKQKSFWQISTGSGIQMEL